MQKKLTVSNNDNAFLRIDKYLAQELNEHSREFIMRLIDDKKITVMVKLLSLLIA